jgi:type I protein arginine methyltransferase
MYDLRHYGQMVNDRVRMDAYSAALQHTVRPGSVVVDIGTGFGILALLACRYGASRVYAIEPNEAVFVGHEIAAANGFGDRIVFIQDLSAKVELPEPADLVVSDLRGSLPIISGHFEAVIDARTRFLKPGGALIPQQDRLVVAPAHAPDLYQQLVSPWVDNHFGFDLSSAVPYVRNAWHNRPVKPDQLVGVPQVWTTIDYATVTGSQVAGSASWTLSEPGEVDGFALWFDATIYRDVGFSTGPESPKTVYGGGYLPLQEPITVPSGGSLEVVIQANPVAGEYVWRWTTRVETSEGVRNFRQSTFFSQPRSAEQMRVGARDQIAALTEDGRIDALALDCMGRGDMDNGAIADLLVERFPHRFPDRRAALGRVADLAIRYASS